MLLTFKAISMFFGGRANMLELNCLQHFMFNKVGETFLLKKSLIVSEE